MDRLSDHSGRLEHKRIYLTFVSTEEVGRGMAAGHSSAGVFQAGEGAWPEYVAKPFGNLQRQMECYRRNRIEAWQGVRISRPGERKRGVLA